MTILDQLGLFLGSPNPAIARSAELVQQAAEQRAAGKITAEEYAALCKSATDLDAIAADMTDAAMLQQAQEAINLISQIAASYV